MVARLKVLLPKTVPGDWSEKLTVVAEGMREAIELRAAALGEEVEVMGWMGS
jgi:hypothetical protein